MFFGLPCSETTDMQSWLVSAFLEWTGGKSSSIFEEEFFKILAQLLFFLCYITSERGLLSNFFAIFNYDRLSYTFTMWMLGLRFSRSSVCEMGRLGSYDSARKSTSSTEVLKGTRAVLFWVGLREFWPSIYYFHFLRKRLGYCILILLRDCLLNMSPLCIKIVVPSDSSVKAPSSGEQPMIITVKSWFTADAAAALLFVYSFFWLNWESLVSVNCKRRFSSC